MPVAPSVPAGRPTAAMPVLSLISPSLPKQLGMVSPELCRRSVTRYGASNVQIGCSLRSRLN